METKVTYEGQVRQPHQIGWIIAAGRLKRVTTTQLRHATERERERKSLLSITLSWQHLGPLEAW